MTIPNTTDKLFYSGNDVAADFDYTFMIYDADQLKVVQIDADGVPTVLEYVTDYTITGINDPAGGQVTLTAGALPTGEKLMIRRTTPGTQLTDIKNQTKFYALTHEIEMDMLAIKDLEQQDQLDKALQFPETENPSVSNVLPSIAERKLNSLMFDEDGAPVAGIPGVSYFGWIPFTGSGNWATNTTITGFYRRVGDTAEIQYLVALAGAPNSGNPALALPAGLTSDAAKIANAIGNAPFCGNGIINDFSTGDNYACSAFIGGEQIILSSGGSPLSLVSPTAPFTFAVGDTIVLKVSVPIEGWA